MNDFDLGRGRALQDKPWMRGLSFNRIRRAKRFKARLANQRAYSAEEMRRGVRRGERIKIIVSGPVIERWEYEIPVKIGKRERHIDPETGEILNGGRTMDVALDENGNVVKIDRTAQVKRTNARRSKMQLRRLVLSNFSNRDKFITLTFRDGSVSDVTNVTDCNKAFDRFIKAMRRKYGDFKYCRVIEFQDSNGRGAVHYHCILTLPYVPYQTLGEVWGNGFVGINAIDHVDNVGAYVQKYMAKDFDDNRLAGKKAFAMSQNVTRPITLYGTEAAWANNEFLRQKKEVFANSYESEYQGNIRYTEYNTNRE